MADVRAELNREISTASFVIHWSAVLGGSFVALGTWMFLLALGAAIQGEKSPNTWTAIYNLVAPIIALFIGGAVAARTRTIGARFDGLLHGAVIWGFTMSVGALLIGVFGSIFMNFNRPGAASAMPNGFAWAIAGSILFSLFAALLGTSSVRERHAVVGRDVPHEV
ncbi:MAG TPA: hypothetical protein VGK67_25205 [Myxococcales bacterium]|jgi:hypothetical protein